MISCRNWTALICASLFGAGLFFSTFSVRAQRSQERYEALKAETTDLSSQAIQRGEDFTTNKNGYITSNKDKQIEVDETFTTHLPLIVIETPKGRPEELHYYDKEQKDYVLREGIERYKQGRISLIHKESGYNSPLDEPEKESSMRIRMRGNSSMLFDKHQYLIKLTHEDGTDNKVNLLGMGKESDWILNISMIDKSLMRNKLSYDLSSQILPGVSDSQYCEVLWKEGDTYTYEGVYLLIEPVEVSKNRVQVTEQRANQPFLPALMRRDRMQDDAVILGNTASADGTYYGAIEVLYPKKEEILPGKLDLLNEQIETFEQTLLSEDPDTFIRYREMVNIDSFVDYFLINEFFGNYDAGNNSTYFYIDSNGKITMGPVWDFDGAMDNWTVQASNNHSTAMNTAPWFSELVRDPEFVRLLSERFVELRRKLLSDEKIEEQIVKYVNELGPAIERDYARWGYFYTSENLEPKNDGSSRNVSSFEEEALRLQNNLKEHGDWLEENLMNMTAVYQTDLSISEPIISNSWAELVKNDLLPVLFLAAFISSIILIQRGYRSA